MFPRILGLLLLLAGPAAAAGEFACSALDAQVEKAMAGWQVPGLALGVVRNGDVLVARTYGVRDIADGAPVTAQTVFALGSVTKSLTALLAAALDRACTLPLDAPVSDTVERFPAGITLRHLLSHRAGWPRHDALWYLDAFDRGGIADRLALLPRFAPPGRAFQYNNVTYAAVGQAVERATGIPWDAHAKASILEPAGMTLSGTTVAGFRSAANRASGYFPADRGPVPLPLRDTDPVAPAAGLHAPLSDMLRYLELLATDGRVGERQVVPKGSVPALLAPSPSADGGAYGLGFNLADWRGRRLAYHPGVIDGYGARLSLLPDDATGIIVLSNLSGRTPVAQIVSQTLLDCLDGRTDTDWVARFGHRRPPPGPASPAPATVAQDRPVAAYAGRFAHPAYGAIELEPAADGAHLTGRFHGRVLRLAYAGADRWRLAETDWPLREGLLFEFADMAEGRFGRLLTPLADGPTYRHRAGPLPFSRVPLHSGGKNPL